MHEKDNGNDCLTVDFYNQENDDFTAPDGKPDCKWYPTMVNKDGDHEIICGTIDGLTCPEGSTCELDSDDEDAGGKCVGENFCGGIAGTPCPDGYRCVMNGNYPDAGGSCVIVNDLKNPNDMGCGGVDNILCPKGYYCEYIGDNLYAGGKCVKSESQNNATNIRTYQATGYSFNYPSDMVVNKSSEANIIYVETQNYRPFKEGSYHVQITESRENIPTVKIYSDIESNTPEYSFTKNQEFVDINGYKALVRTYVDNWKQYKRYYIYTPEMGITFHGTGDLEGSNHAILDNIVRSIKFGDKIKPQLGDAASEAECIEKGGTWDKWGRARLEYCQMPSNDFEKDCMNASDCQYGKCLAGEGESIPGKCQKYQQVFGCRSYIEDGKISISELCID